MSSIPKLHEYGPTRSARCLWMLRELGVPFQAVEVDLPRGEHKSAEYLALNPFGRVPVLQDGELVIFESAAICLYLADKHPEKGLAPKPGTPARARHDQWVFFVMTELDQPLWRIRRHTVLYAEERRIPGEVANARADFAEAALVLQGELEQRPYLGGERFSVADILAAHTLFWSTWNGLLKGFPTLQAWLDRQLEREACPGALKA